MDLRSGCYKVLVVDSLQILDQADVHPFMHQISDYISQVCHLSVRFAYMHSFGIVLYQLDSTLHKYMLLAGNPHVIDGVDVNFVNEDHALNRREWDYTRYGWIMLLGYPIEYRNLEHIGQAVSSFGKVVT
jgi:hypothetical protein